MAFPYYNQNSRKVAWTYSEWYKSNLHKVLKSIKVQRFFKYKSTLFLTNEPIVGSDISGRLLCDTFAAKLKVLFYKINFADERNLFLNKSKCVKIINLNEWLAWTYYCHFSPSLSFVWKIRKLKRFGTTFTKTDKSALSWKQWYTLNCK